MLWCSNRWSSSFLDGKRPRLVVDCLQIVNASWCYYFCLFDVFSCLFIPRMGSALAHVLANLSLHSYTARNHSPDPF